LVPVTGYGSECPDSNFTTVKHMRNCSRSNRFGWL